MAKTKANITGTSKPLKPARADEIPLSPDELRAVAAFAADCAAEVLDLFEHARPGDARPREAIATARAFARGGPRGKALRDAAWGAMRAAGECGGGDGDGGSGAREAARAAMSAAGAAYLHPLARATQVRHILGAAAHAARAAELAAGGDPTVGADHMDRSAARATPRVVEVLGRYPRAPAGGGRVGDLLRAADERLRREASVTSA